MKKITVSAPGKVMLLGEHSVVYDRPCLVTAVDSRMNLTLELIDKDYVEINAPQVNVRAYKRNYNQLKVDKDMPKGVRFIEAVISILQKNYGIKYGMRITTKNGFSAKYGLGSSSAVSVSMVKAVSEIMHVNLPNKKIFEIAYKSVLDVQGVGSGFDVAAATWGGTLYYQTGGKIIEPLNIKPLPLLVVYSGIKADTVTIVKDLSKKRIKYLNEIDGMFDQITTLVNEGKYALQNNKLKTFGMLMNDDQRILNDLGVSTDVIHNICVSAMLAGAYGAKLTGAGGGDCVIVLVNNQNKHKIEQAVVKAGGDLVPVETGAEGVRVEN